jgi:hypothetical protein
MELLRASRLISTSSLRISVSWAICALKLMGFRHESNPSPKKQEGYICQETQNKK